MKNKSFSVSSVDGLFKSFNVPGLWIFFVKDDSSKDVTLCVFSSALSH